jgi:adenylyltransferase/sulfurtransferase
MTLNEDEKRRYARQTVLAEIGEVGQEKLKSAKVLIVGAGGLGSPALLYLAAAGVGTLGIADGDKVELSNLQRQIVHETGDIGRLKTESAADAIEDLNPEVMVVEHGEITTENAEKIIFQYDLVIDGCDNFASRFLIHDICLVQKKPYLFAAIQGFEGQLSTFKGYEEYQPCYRCFCPELPPAGTIPNCSENGVLGSVAGILGTWQASEAVKELLQIGKTLSGSVLLFDILNSTTRKVSLVKDAVCELCNN